MNPRRCLRSRLLIASVSLLTSNGVLAQTPASAGDFLRSPSDPRDRNTPEPPQPKDEFVLKFVRP